MKRLRRRHRGDGSSRRDRDERPWVSIDYRCRPGERPGGR